MSPSSAMDFANMSVARSHLADRMPSKGRMAGPPGVHHVASASTVTSVRSETLSPPISPRLTSRTYDSDSTCPMDTMAITTTHVKERVANVGSPASSLVFPLRLSQPPSRSTFTWADESPERDNGDIVDLAKFSDWIAPRADPDHNSMIDSAPSKGSQGPVLQATSLPDEVRMAPVEDGSEHIPLDEFGELSSIGSIAHAAGKCQPCLFWFQLTCEKGVQCTYCHLSHPGQKKKRIRMSKKVRLELQAMNVGKPPLSSCDLARRYGDWAASQERPVFGSCPGVSPEK